jgi:hypothetical protein
VTGTDAEPVADPRAEVTALLAASYDRWAEEGDADGSPRRVLTLAELVADDAALLRSTHATLVDQGVPPPAAATYLAGWYGAGLAGALGLVVAVTGAVPDLDAAAVRLTVHPDGWVERVDIGAPRLLVGPEHPWAGLAGVTVVRDETERHRRLVAGLTGALTPLIDSCHGLARIGRAGLWNEVGDGFGMCLAHQLDIPVDATMTGRLAAVLAVDGAPWRARPALRFGRAGFGEVHLAQKGGCCLAYTEVVDEDAHDDEAEDEEHRAYRTRFPDDPGAPRYCSTCSLRDADDCDARQVFWLEQHHERRTAASPT